uniref:ATPase subunit 8 n=1 Tax=Megaris sp. TaxID=2931300 RepID=A0A8T9ZXI2_9HEMI|nr:ATPase subunit 8 [Megaris sp.]
MPQMSPMMWNMLFLYFNLLMLLMMICHYFIKFNYPGNNKIALFKPSYSWKW